MRSVIASCYYPFRRRHPKTKWNQIKFPSVFTLLQNFIIRYTLCILFTLQEFIVYLDLNLTSRWSRFILLIWIIYYNSNFILFYEEKHDLFIIRKLYDIDNKIIFVISTLKGLNACCAILSCLFHRNINRTFRSSNSYKTLNFFLLFLKVRKLTYQKDF